MSVVVELKANLLEEAGQAIGLSEPSEVVERALRQLIRVEAYRSSAAARGLNLDEEQVLRRYEQPFITADTYQPMDVPGPCTEEERRCIIDEAIAGLDKDESLSPERKAAYRGLIELGGSDPMATAPPQRRFW